MSSQCEAELLGSASVFVLHQYHVFHYVSVLPYKALQHNPALVLF